MKKRLTGRWLIAVLVASFLGALPVIAQKADDAEVQLQAAYHKQLVEGQLEEAIKVYKSVIAKPGVSRTVAAKALVQMGQCYEKLGDTEARRAYERVLRDFADQNEAVSEARTRLAALGGSAKTTEMVTRRVWAGPDVAPEGGVSRDGRFIAYPYWDTGDLAVFDLATGEKRRITHKGTWADNDEFAEFSAPSPDGKQIAYAWYKEGVYELRVIGIDGSHERTIFRNDNVTYMEPMAWSPSGNQIFAAFYTKDEKMQIVSVSVVDGSERIFKTFPPRPFSGIHMSLSPDGRYLAYDFPQSDNYTHRDIACLSTGADWEGPLIEHPADDAVFGWAPDGGSILFTSDRTGQTSIWTLELAEGKPKGAPRLLKAGAGRVVPLGVTQKGAVYYGLAAGIREMYTAELDFASGKLLSPPKPVTQHFTGRNSSPDWSPDGSRLAYLSVRRGIDKYGWGNPADTIVIRSLATGEEREIVLEPVSVASFQGLRWAPDGRSLVVTGQSSDAKRGAYRVDVETGKLTLLIDHGQGQSYSLPELTPDNKAFVSRRNVWRENVDRIVVHDLQTGQERELGRRRLARPGVLPAEPDVRLSPDCLETLCQFSRFQDAILTDSRPGNNLSR